MWKNMYLKNSLNQTSSKNVMVIIYYITIYTIH